MQPAWFPNISLPLKQLWIAGLFDVSAVITGCLLLKIDS